MAGFSPSFIDYGLRDYSLFIGLLSYAYFLSLSLLFTLLIPRFRQAIVAGLGKRLIFMQLLITVPFVLWGSMMIVILINQHG
jgi:hypothetical protein